MRFWRQNVPDEAAPDADSIPPEAAEVATTEPAAAAPPPELAPETPSEQLRNWFGRLRSMRAAALVAEAGSVALTGKVSQSRSGSGPLAARPARNAELPRL